MAEREQAILRRVKVSEWVKIRPIVMEKGI